MTIAELRGDKLDNLREKGQLFQRNLMSLVFVVFIRYLKKQ